MRGVECLPLREARATNQDQRSMLCPCLVRSLSCFFPTGIVPLCPSLYCVHSLRSSRSQKGVGPFVSSGVMPPGVMSRSVTGTTVTLDSAPRPSTHPTPSLPPNNLRPTEPPITTMASKAANKRVRISPPHDTL